MSVEDGHCPFICKSDRLVKQTAVHAHVKYTLVLQCELCLHIVIYTTKGSIEGEKGM